MRTVQMCVVGVKATGGYDSVVRGKGHGGNESSIMIDYK